MVRNNNVIPNSHFRKDWDKRVRVYLDQASKKKKRSVARQEKAAKAFPKPVSGLLRPVVRCMSIKYNRRQRLGRGFTLEELRAAGVEVAAAQSLGISVDYRRTNKDEKALQENIRRIQIYKSKLVLFPKRVKKNTKKPQKPKAGDASPEELKKVTQTKVALPLTASRRVPKARVATADEKKESVYAKLRKLRNEARNVGRKAKEAEAAEAAAKK
jgi:large subunit ribosomal protein L13e